ncbi:site-specific integrase [Flagellimonas hymeniacidonis]|uniref:Site-specific integrase n=1 Tax=Flagellimonas hymeniacidonis TaxID=2603628 RepID=A0A5C8V523_9FLAO|nr:site-specific integrase [Flagellimonas hymeniacidonis]TXN36122.1 site-specific integrase [Flagellimonas hymeniacidonis]
MSSRATLSINFFPRKREKDSEKSTVYCRITVNGERLEFSLQRKLQCHLWNNARKRGMGHSPLVTSLNSYLDQVYFGLLEAHRELLREGQRVTPLAIKSRYMHIGENGKTLKDLIGYHNGTMHTSIKAGTRKNYYSTEKYLYQFLDKKIKVKDMYLKQVNYRFITDFEHYLRDYKDSKKQLSMGNNGVMKHLERFKKIINLAIKLEWMDKNPFERFQLKYNKYDRVFLMERELELLEQTEFKNERLQKVKDCFVFSCYTGLSYTDVKELTEDNIVKGIDNNNWIYTKREKTDELVKVPILPKAWILLEKYKTLQNERLTTGLLPISSNQKTNSYLKEIAKSCGIYKNISFHTARHTFATTVTLFNGLPIETVSKLLGHSKITTTQIYAKVLERKVSEDMCKLEDKFERG